MSNILTPILLASALTSSTLTAQIAIEAETLYPMTGDLKPIKNGVVLCGASGKIEMVGTAAEVSIPIGYQRIKAKVVMPGIIDAHATVGLSGILNSDKHDQEQLEKSAPIQPELRAIDAYNGRDPLVKWVRDLGITTVHTGHAPGALVSGQTMILKTNVTSITDAGKDTLRQFAMVAATLGSDGFAVGDEDKALRRKLHQTIAGVAGDVEALSFNKAVAKIFELVNLIEKSRPSADRTIAIKSLARIVAPMVPHIAEEAWALFGETGLIADAPWPEVDESLLIEDEVTIAIQVRGKLRDTITVAKGSSKEHLEELALASEKVQRSLDGAEVKKVIVVPDRLVNIVV